MPIVESRYAKALLDIAVSSKNVDKMENELNDFTAVITNQGDFNALMLDPIVSRAIKKETAQKILSKDTPPMFVNFISLLIDKDRLKQLPVICDEYIRLKSELLNNLDINVFSAYPLEESQLEEIKKTYLKKYNTVSATINQHIEPNLIGGVRIEIGNTCIDDTLTSRLQGLRSFLERTWEYDG